MRIFVADAELEVRNALRLLLRQEPGVQVVGETNTAWGLPARVQAATPDLLLLDWELPGPPIMDLLPTLRTICSGARGQSHVIVLSLRPEAEGAALEAGADAFVSKTDPPARLLAAVRRFRQNGST